jgi:large subunit ribosomal protein L15e
MQITISVDANSVINISNLIRDNIMNSSQSPHTIIKGKFLRRNMPSVQDKVWYTMWKENSPELRQRAILWRKQNAVTRIERPSRLLRAKRLGYKAKQGIIVVRMRVGTGGMRRQRPRGGRRPKHLGVTRIKADDSMKVVADRRVLERYPNMKLLGSYFLYKDGMHYWYEVILADPSHPRIVKDKELRKRVLPSVA